MVFPKTTYLMIFKLGMMGTSVLYSSGDDGVAGLYGADELLTVLLTSPYRCRWDEDCWETTG